MAFFYTPDGIVFHTPGKIFTYIIDIIKNSWQAFYKAVYKQSLIGAGLILTKYRQPGMQWARLQYIQSQ